MIFLKKRGVISYATPTLISSAGSGTGQAMTPADTATGDFVLHLATSPSLVVPTQPVGLTAFGSGISCDETGNDTSIMVSGKFITAGETIPAVLTGSRAVCIAFRDIDPAYLSDLTGDYSYDATLDANLVIDPLTLVRPAVVVALGTRMGTGTTPFTDLTLIRVSSESNQEARAHWTNGLVETFPGYSYAMSSTTARATCAVALYGAEV